MTRVKKLMLTAAIAGAAGAGTLRDRRTLWGFTEPSDPRSTRSALMHAAELDVLVTGWIALDSVTGRPLVPHRDTLVRAGSRTPRYLALVTSWQGQGFHAAPVRYLAGNDGALAATAGAIARIVTSAGYQGAVIDF